LPSVIHIPYEVIVIANSMVRICEITLLWDSQIRVPHFHALLQENSCEEEGK